MVTKGKKNYVSTLPGDATEGGFWDGVQLEITRADVVTFDYRDKAGTSHGSAPGVNITLFDGIDEREQFFSAGSADQFKPAADGLSLEPIGTRETLTKQCNLYRFLLSLSEAGIEDEKINGEDFSRLAGTKFICIQVPDPNDKTGKRTLLAAESLVIETGKSSKGGGKASSKIPAADEVRDEAVTVLFATLLGNDDPIAKNRLVPKMMVNIDKDSKNKKAITTLCTDDAFLNSVEGIEFVDGIISLVD